MRTSRNFQGNERGVTLVELLVYMVLSMIVLGSVYSVMVDQSRQYTLHRETMDARETLRGAAAILTAEFRQASAARDDFYAIGAQSVALRSVQGSGIVCAVHATLPRYALWDADGDFQASADDSALAYAPVPGQWKRLHVTQAWGAPSGAGFGACVWSGAIAPSVALAVTVGDTLGVGVGSSVLAFRPVQYGMFQQAGHWWLGRKVGAAASYDVVTGPLRSPADSGLALHYYDATGAETADSSQVVRVEIVLRAESAGKARTAGGYSARHDSVTISAFLRN